jgi:amidase
VPLAPTFDVVGLFARDVATLALGARALLDGEPAAWEPAELLVALDAFAEAGEATRAALAPALAAVADRLGGGLGREVLLAPAPDDLDAHRAAYVTLQGAEAWRTLGGWIEEARPALGPGVAQRFAAGAAMTSARETAAGALRIRARESLRALLGTRGVLCLPAAEGPPAPRELPAEASAGLRARNLRLLSTAGLAGAPVLVLPGGEVEGCPVGLALLGPPGADEALLALGAALRL